VITIDTVAIDATTARHILWHYGIDGGQQPTAFTARLIGTIEIADQADLNRLRTIYPTLVAAGLRCGGCGTTDGPLAGAYESLCGPCRATAA
jgi:hypothetical protein